MCWTLSPSCSNVGLDKLLIKRGLVETDPATGMVTDLAEVERAPWPDGLEISLANDDKGMADFIRVTAEGFDIPDGLWGGWSALMLSNTGPEFNHFVGYLGGKPVSASMALHRGDIASFYNIVTLEDARGKGIGGAITRESMLHAKGKGIRTGILEASKMGLPVYERLGFRKVCEFRMFVWMHAMDQ
ncbi:MAG TPA: GNAT family N-acetyltransferase [Methanomassiliicoccales archaeon]|nr:GNAT family N-acetyltransferase [Methanomassiliicoccales archaeon]